VGALLNVLVCSIWFLGSCAFAKFRPAAEQMRVEEFFNTMKTPVNFEKEGGVASDSQQCRTLGTLCLIYGSFLALMLMIPNAAAGRAGILFCVACMLIPGGILYCNPSRRKRLDQVKASTASQNESFDSTKGGRH
jgi:hypothetical protein